MEKTHIIGFCGKAGCGKGTVSDMIKSLRVASGFNDSVKIFPLAYELKRIALNEFGWDGEKDERGRKLLQTLGTECGRMYGGENFWVDKWKSKVNVWRNEFVVWSWPQYPIVICDDVRFDNEAQSIIDMGGHICSIQGRSYDMGDNNNHSSESGISIDLIGSTIINNGSMNDLNDSVISLMKDLNISMG